MGVESTKSYTQGHIYNVRKLINKFADVLRTKGDLHDQSKLEEPEIYGWAAMDLEPRYAYGSHEYFDKLNRFADVFKHHYAVNTHHPEHFKNPEQEMTLVDMIEMLCDWFAYKQDVSLEEGIALIYDQCDRFKFSKTIRNLLINTYTEYMNSEFFRAEIFEHQQRIVADIELKTTANFDLWKNYFNPQCELQDLQDIDSIPDSGIDFSDLLWWEKYKK